MDSNQNQTERARYFEEQTEDVPLDRAYRGRGCLPVDEICGLKLAAGDALFAEADGGRFKESRYLS